MRIVVADDQREVRAALRLLLEHQDGMTVVGEAAGPGDLESRLRDLCPDLLLLDWELGGLSGAALVHVCRAACPSAAIIALSGRVQSPSEVVSAGADGFVGKNEPPEYLLRMLSRMAQETIPGDPA